MSLSLALKAIRFKSVVSLVDSKVVILSAHTQLGFSNSEALGSVIRVNVGCWALVCLLLAFPAAAQRVVLHVDGHVPVTPFTRADADAILGALSLEEWSVQDQESVDPERRERHK